MILDKIRWNVSWYCTEVRLSVAVGASEVNKPDAPREVLAVGEVVTIIKAAICVHTPPRGGAVPELTARNAVYRAVAPRERKYLTRGSRQRDPTPEAGRMCLATDISQKSDLRVMHIVGAIIEPGMIVYLIKEFKYPGGRAGEITVPRGAALYLRSIPLSRSGSDRVSRREEAQYEFERTESGIEKYQVGNHGNNMVEHNQVEFVRSGQL
ncbi:hypothetical protein FPV67DRAFT_1456716 [Lyophyllum atratum]|nr:hypothetical protein FPV67DRAFT_1456716 [Lyophyllum atratum]